jgi:hypothetical protein
MNWGLLGPEHLAGTRRTRTLGLGAAVRQFNQLAVPGLGGMWFAKQLLIATLGVRLADHLRAANPEIKPIGIANAVEALACWCACESTEWEEKDSRIRGRLKMPRNRPTFADLCKPRFYVTQPMRMAMSEPLVDLAFVDTTSQRFNNFTCTTLGTDLIDAATAGLKPRNRSVEKDILHYARAPGESISATSPLIDALSPLITMNGSALGLVRNRLCEGSGTSPDADRRTRALAWVKRLGKDPKKVSDWAEMPPELQQDHWRDLRLGAKFFATRDAAINVLDAIEGMMSGMSNLQRTPDDAAKSDPVLVKIEALKVIAEKFLEVENDKEDFSLARNFCRECTASKPANIIRNLVKRDDRVLRLVGDTILPGRAFSFRQTEAADEDDEGIIADVPVPAGISGRIRNLYLLEQDLQGNLGNILKPSSSEVVI